MQQLEDKVSTLIGKVESVVMRGDDLRVPPVWGTHEALINQTLATRGGLIALKDNHYQIIADIHHEEGENKEDEKKLHHKDGVGSSGEQITDGVNNTVANRASGKNNCGEEKLLSERLAHVMSSLERLEVGIEESNVLLALSDHFSYLESDRSILQMEMDRLGQENEWLREELEESQRRTCDAESELAQLREEKRQWQFLEELKKNVNESASHARPITPSKIPVGGWRVDEEKAINRAMQQASSSSSSSSSSSAPDSNRASRSASPAPSRIPISNGVGGWRNKASAYKKVMEKQEMKRSMLMTTKVVQNKTSERHVEEQEEEAIQKGGVRTEPSLIPTMTSSLLLPSSQQKHHLSGSRSMVVVTSRPQQMGSNIPAR